MAGNTGPPSSSTMRRWTTLVVVAANIAFVADYSILSESPTITEVVAEYGKMFVPAGFAQAICAAILVAFMLFYFDALWPRRHRIRVYDKLVIPLAMTSVLASSWIVAFRQKEIGLAAALVAASFALSAVMFVRVTSVSPSQHSSWLRVPFSLHFGAMTIALLVAVTQWLNAGGLLTEIAVMPDQVAIAFLAIAAAAAGFVALRYSDFVYPAVIASGASAMFIVQRTYNPHIAADALIVSVGMLLVVVLAAVTLTRQPRRDPKVVASRRRAKAARRAQDEWYLIDGNSSIMRL
jgi:benzodiazapine receptor